MKRTGQMGWLVVLAALALFVACSQPQVVTVEVPGKDQVVTVEVPVTVTATSDLPAVTSESSGTATRAPLACSAESSYVLVIWDIKTHTGPGMQFAENGALLRGTVVEIAEAKEVPGGTWYKVGDLLSGPTELPPRGVEEHWFSRLTGYLRYVPCENNLLVDVPLTGECVQAKGDMTVYSLTGDVAGNASQYHVFTVLDRPSDDCVVVDVPEWLADSHEAVCVRPEDVIDIVCPTPAAPATCGDLQCNVSSETCVTCSSDCGVCADTPTP